MTRQWSWPLWLPVQFFGIFPSSILRDNDTTTPWADELEQKIFSSAVGVCTLSELQLYNHRSIKAQSRQLSQMKFKCTAIAASSTM